MSHVHQYYLRNRQNNKRAVPFFHILLTAMRGIMVLRFAVVRDMNTNFA